MHKVVHGTYLSSAVIPARDLVGKELTPRLVAGRESFALLFPQSVLATDRLLLYRYDSTEYPN